MGFDADWLAARAPYDEAALDQTAVAAVQARSQQVPAEYRPVVVDLGSGTGVALERVRRWLAPRPILGYAMDRDANLLARITPPRDGSLIVPTIGDLLAPLDRLGGPPDGTVDLVVGHALADLLPLDRLAERVMALLRPGGLGHLALVYDGLTAFASGDDPAHDVDADLEMEVIAAFHRHMDLSTRETPSYGGSTAGRRLGAALASAGLALVVDVPTIWRVESLDGHGGRAVLDGLLRFVVEAAREVGSVPPNDLAHWEQARRAALTAGALTARVGHRDLLARKPER